MADLERQSNLNTIQQNRDKLLRLHTEKCSYGKLFNKGERVRLKKYGIVYTPRDKPKWYAELTMFTKEVLGVE